MQKGAQVARPGGNVRYLLLVLLFGLLGFLLAIHAFSHVILPSIQGTTK